MVKKYKDKYGLAKGSKYIIVGTSPKGSRKVIGANYRKKSTAVKDMNRWKKLNLWKPYKRVTVVKNPKRK